MKYEVVYTDNFARELKRLARKYRSVKDDLEALITSLEDQPVQGTTLRKNCYKIRMAITSKGKGKSSGARVITHVYVSGQKVYLLAIYDKSDRESISDREIEELLALIR